MPDVKNPEEAIVELGELQGAIDRYKPAVLENFPKTSMATMTRKEAYARRALKAMELREQGKSYEVIASTLSVSNATAFQMVQRALSRFQQEAAEDVKKMEVKRLDRMLDALWDRAMAGDDKAVERILQIMDKRAKYLGLYAPIEVKHGIEKTPQELIMEAQRLGIEVPPHVLQLLGERIGDEVSEKLNGGMRVVDIAIEDPSDYDDIPEDFDENTTFGEDVVDNQ